ncbi:MAG: SDR family NAD(P)-dependent oxidoreductase [Fidelibacterota bacterium]
MKMDWIGKNAVVTGASRGIGVYIIKALAEKGVSIAGVARSETGLINAQSIAVDAGGSFYSFPFDLTRTEKLPELIKSILSTVGKIDFLINNAGVEQYQYYHQVPPEDLQSIVRTNLLAPMELTRVVLGSMLDQGSGHVVNIASLAGKKGVAYNSIYSATKGGLIQWTDGLRQELVDTPVNISVICPGYIAEAGMFYDSGGKPPALLGMSKPEAVAKAVMKALQNNSSEIIVNKGPIRPLLALGQLSPKLGDWVVKKFGVPAMSRKRIRS